MTMTGIGWLRILVACAAIVAVAKPLGVYVFRVFEGHSPPLPRVLGELERLLHRLSGVDPNQEHTWKQYALGLLVFSAKGALVTYLLQRTDQLLPFNSRHPGAVEHGSALNTATSIVTNTSWHVYPGASTMSYLAQFAGLAWRNFTWAAAAICVALALARRFARRPGPDGPTTLGNFYVDLIRGIVYIFLPLSIAFGIVVVWRACIQALSL